MATKRPTNRPDTSQLLDEFRNLIRGTNLYGTDYARMEADYRERLLSLERGYQQGLTGYLKHTRGAAVQPQAVSPTATSVRSAQGRTVAPQRLASRFVVPRTGKRVTSSRFAGGLAVQPAEGLAI